MQRHLWVIPLLAIIFLVATFFLTYRVLFFLKKRQIFAFMFSRQHEPLTLSAITWSHPAGPAERRPLCRLLRPRKRLLADQTDDMRQVPCALNLIPIGQQKVPPAWFLPDLQLCVLPWRAQQEKMQSHLARVSTRWFGHKSFFIRQAQPWSMPLQTAPPCAR